MRANVVHDGGACASKVAATEDEVVATNIRV